MSQPPNQDPIRCAAASASETETDCTGNRVAKSEPAIPSLLTAAEVRELLRCSDRTIRRWVARGFLQPVRFGRTLRFRADDVRRLVSDRHVSTVLARAGGKKTHGGDAVTSSEDADDNPL